LDVIGDIIYFKGDGATPTHASINSTGLVLGSGINQFGHRLNVVGSSFLNGDVFVQQKLRANNAELQISANNTGANPLKLATNGDVETNGDIVFNDLNKELSIERINFSISGTYIRSWAFYSTNIMYQGANSFEFKDRNGATTFLSLNSTDLTINGGVEMNFGSTTRQMINLWSTVYGIGVQGNTQYFRTGDDFCWFKGGIHNDIRTNPGTGGSVQMILNSSGNLGIGTTAPAKKLEIQSTGNDHLRLQYSTGFFWDINRNTDGSKLYFTSENGTKYTIHPSSGDTWTAGMIETAGTQTGGGIYWSGDIFAAQAKMSIIGNYNLSIRNLYNSDIFMANMANGICETQYGLNSVKGSSGVYLYHRPDGAEPSIYPSTNNYGRIGTNTNRMYEVHSLYVYQNGSQVSSDDRLKHNEEGVVDALGTINKLELFKYDKTVEMLDADFNGDLGDIKHRKEAGFIAQDIQQIPELAFLVGGGGTATRTIKEESRNHETDEIIPAITEQVDLPYYVDYNSLFSISVQAIQELDAKCKAQQEQINNLIQIVNELREANTSTAS
jgi:hypothetical protein